MTISDIAKLAGVSSAAVSRYLNGGPLSEQKRAVIQAVVEQTGYSPDTAAQTLRTGIARRQGVQDALREAGLNADGLPRAYCAAFSMEEGHRCMEELLARCPQLDGVICVTDTVAFGALQVLRAAGRRVGEDVGLAGIGDNWAGKVVQPGLTTIRFYQKQVGQEAARMLLQSLEHTGPDAAPVRQTTLGYTLVERGSL